MCLVICTSERWRVRVLDVHHNFDKAVRYCPLSCSVKPVPALKWAAGGPHHPCPHLPPPTLQALCLEGMGVFAFGQRPLVWSSPSPDASPSGSGFYWILRSPAEEPGRGQADLLSAPRHHLSTRHCTCREEKKIWLFIRFFFSYTHLILWRTVLITTFSLYLSSSSSSPSREPSFLQWGEHRLDVEVLRVWKVKMNFSFLQRCWQHILAKQKLNGGVLTSQKETHDVRDSVVMQ